MSGLEQGFSAVASSVVRKFVTIRKKWEWEEDDFKDKIITVSFYFFCGVPLVLGRFLYAIIKEVLHNE